MPLYNPHIWYPIIGRKVLIKVTKRAIDEAYYLTAYAPLTPHYTDEESIEERYYLGKHKGLYLVSGELPHKGSMAYYVDEVFEVPKKEYTMQEIADALKIKVEDLRIKE